MNEENRWRCIIELYIILLFWSKRKGKKKKKKTLESWLIPHLTSDMLSTLQRFNSHKFNFSINLL